MKQNKAWIWGLVSVVSAAVIAAVTVLLLLRSRRMQELCDECCYGDDCDYDADYTEGFDFADEAEEIPEE